MRIAVSGSHATGKSTLIAAFLARRPEYVHEPEAYETLADDIDLTSSEGPTPEALRALLDFTAGVVASRSADERVIFERSPVDYLGYAAACRHASPDFGAFLSEAVPVVRASLRHLDLIVLLPASGDGRADEDPRFRRRVDDRLRRALIDDDHDLLGAYGSPRVVELPPDSGRQLDALFRLTEPRRL
jgi:predicted ATPase